MLIGLLNYWFGSTLISLISCQITKRAGWNKHGGWNFLEKTSTYVNAINEE